MARLPRLTLPGYQHHVIQRGNNRQPIFVSDSDRRVLLALWAEYANKFQVAVHAYVLMSNHFHLLVTPSSESGLPQMMQAVGRRYVRHFNDAHGRSGTLWEGRFRSSMVEADRYLLACQPYIESNPQRAGMVESVADWPWSSHRHHVGLAVDPLVNPHPTVWALGNTPFERESAYRKLFDESISRPEYEWLRERLLAGKPTASTDFQKNLEAARGLRLIARPVGRPRVRPLPAA